MEKTLPNPNTKKKYSFNPFIQWNLKLAVCFAFVFIHLAPILAQKGINNTSSQQTSFVIKGTVKDEQGNPIIGAAVLLTDKYPLKAGYSTILRGTTTDFEGTFKIKGSLNNFIIIHFVGFEDYHQKITQKKHIYEIILKEKTNKIDEVVVTGIVNKRKESFTGAAKSFSGKQLRAIGNLNVLKSLAMLDPDLMSIENNNMGSDPNTTPKLRIRGENSIPPPAGSGLRDKYGNVLDPNLPLFILDGFETSIRTVMDLDINRIASVTILKDVASTALYGSQASNGVIVIETVRPTKGRLQISYNQFTSLQFPDLRDYNLMNAAQNFEYLKLSGFFDYSEYRVLQKVQPLYDTFATKLKEGVDTYWMSLPLREGIGTTQSLQLTGGSDAILYIVGLKYGDTKGVMKGSYRKTWGGNIRLEYRKNKLRVFNLLNINGSKSSDSPYGNFGDYAQMNPLFTKVNRITGKIEKFVDSDKKISNPLYNSMLNSFSKKTSLNLNNNLNVQWDLNSNVRVNANFQLGKTTSVNKNFISPKNTRYKIDKPEDKGGYVESNWNSEYYNFNLNTSYSNIFAQKHHFTVSLRGEVSESKSNRMKFSLSGFPLNSSGNPAFARKYSTYLKKPNITNTLVRKVGLVATTNYGFNRTFFVDGTYRLDGSTSFGSRNKYSPFWGVGVGLSLNQLFHMNKRKVSLLKLRGNIGVTGNQNMGTFSSETVYTFNNNNNNNNYNQPSLYVQSIGNPNLKWQNTTNLSLGIDATLFNNRLGITLNGYENKTDPLITDLDLPPSSGVPSIKKNLGTLTSKGLTAIVNVSPVYDLKNNITWVLTLMGRVNKSTYDHFDDNTLRNLNTLYQDYYKISLKDDYQRKYPVYLNRFKNGHSPSDLWAVPSLGIDPFSGLEVFLTRDGLRTYAFDKKNERMLGNSTPDLSGSINNMIRIKNFTLSISIAYRFGGDIFNRTLYSKVENIISKSSLLQHNRDVRALTARFHKRGDISSFKSIRDFRFTPISSRFIQKENTIDLQSINISYEFINKPWMKKIGISRLGLRAMMSDVFRISSIKRERGINYPFARSISFNLNVNF